MKITTRWYSQSVAVLAGPKLPNTLGLGSHYSVSSDCQRFVLDDVRCMTGLTSTSGLMTISPEGGP